MYRIDNRVPKVVRVRTLTRYLAQSWRRFKADSPGARLLVRQLEDFPNADHDDGPDALEMVMRVGKMMIASGRADGKQFEVMEATRYRGARRGFSRRAVPLPAARALVMRRRTPCRLPLSPSKTRFGRSKRRSGGKHPTPAGGIAIEAC